jgi:hypothetical protein
MKLSSYLFSVGESDASAFGCVGTELAVSASGALGCGVPPHPGNETRTAIANEGNRAVK